MISDCSPFLEIAFGGRPGLTTSLREPASVPAEDRRDAAHNHSVAIEGVLDDVFSFVQFPEFFRFTCKHICPFPN